MKRILDCHSSDFLHMSRQELLDAIASGEGRTIACETIGAIMPMLGESPTQNSPPPWGQIFSC